MTHLRHVESDDEGLSERMGKGGGGYRRRDMFGMLRVGCCDL